MSQSTSLWGPVKVGADILSYCARCKMELAHVVVSMLDTRPAKVVCKTCKAEHKFRLAPGSTPRASKRGRVSKSPAKTTVRASELWEEKMAACKKESIDYNIKHSFSSGDLIQHSMFGLGIVEEAHSNGKMLVLFRGGEKLLVHGRS